MAKAPVRSDWLIVGERLKAARNVLGLQQNEFCDPLGMSPSHYSQLERGLKGISLATAKKFKKVWGISLDWIFFGDVGMETKMAVALRAVQEKRAEAAPTAQKPPPEPPRSRPRPRS
jgi:transcriptional regulator with XRE-family HTH domain